MYKTIRHGENSLQYTILPQNDDFRIEGKLSTAESSNSSNGNSSGTSSRRCRSGKNGRTPRRRSFFAYLGLIFVCTVIVGAVLIPFLVSAECLPSPTEWFLKTKAALIKGSGMTALTLGSTSISSSSSSSASNTTKTQQQQQLKNAALQHDALGKTVQIINQNGIEKFILKLNKTQQMTVNKNDAASQQNQQQQQQHYVSEVRFEPNESSGLLTQTQLSAAPPTIMVTTLLSQNVSPAPAAASASIVAVLSTLPPPPPPPPYVHATAGIVTASVAKQPLTATLTVGAVPPRASSAISGNQFMNNNNNNNNNNIGSSISSPVFISSNAAAITPTITTRIIQVPLLKSAAKKPIVPPVLAKTNSLATNTNAIGISNGLRVDAAAAAVAPPAVPALQTTQYGGSMDKTLEQNTKSVDWINSHWPYIDPSSYFQWTGYKTEDSVLLPALLGFALIGMILIITVCLVARNKRTIVATVRKRNRNDIEEQGAEDNATLLTTTNLSDDD